MTTSTPSRVRTRPHARLTPEQQALVEGVLPAVRKLAHLASRAAHARGAPAEYEAAEAEGMYQATLAALRFDPARGVRFVTFVWASLRLYFRRWLRARAGAPTVRLTEEVAAYLEAPAQEASAALEAAELLDNAARSLSELEFTVLYRHLVRGERLLDIGRDLGRPVGSLSMIERRALARLRRGWDVESIRRSARGRAA